MNERIQNQLSALKIVRNSTHQQIIVDDTIAGIAFDAFEELTRSVLVSVSMEPVRVRFDGTPPTALIGHKLEAGYIAVWSKELAEDALFIREGKFNASVDGQPLTH